MLLEVRQLVDRIRLDGVSSRSPGSRANFAVLVGELESLNKTEVLVNVTANRSIIERQMSQDSIVVNDVGSSEGVASVSKHGTIGLGNSLVEIGKQRNVNLA